MFIIEEFFSGGGVRETVAPKLQLPSADYQMG